MFSYASMLNCSIIMSSGLIEIASPFEINFNDMKFMYVGDSDFNLQDLFLMSHINYLVAFFMAHQLLNSCIML